MKGKLSTSADISKRIESTWGASDKFLAHLSISGNERNRQEMEDAAVAYRENFLARVAIDATIARNSQRTKWRTLKLGYWEKEEGTRQDPRFDAPT